MFFFGLFSTHIPYIILAILYSIGFGAYSFNNIQSKIFFKKEKEFEKEITFIKHKEFKKSSFYFQDFKSNKHAQTTSESKLSEVHEQQPVFDITKILSHPNVTKYYLLVCFDQFSRPPPCI